MEKKLTLKERIKKAHGNPISISAIIISALTALAVSMTYESVKKGAISIASIIGVWTFKIFVKYCPKGAQEIQEAIIDCYYQPPAEWAKFVSAYLERMTGTKISLEDITKEGMGMGSRSSMQAMGKTFLEPMLGLIMPTPSEIKRDPMGGAERFMSANLQFQMSAWLMHMIGDAMSFGMFKSLKDLPNAISWSFGIGWLSWLVMGPPFRMGIAAPMEKFFSRMYTPELLATAQAIEACKKGLMTYDEFVSECLDRGIDPNRANILYQIAEKDLSDGDIKSLVELGWMDEADVKEELVRRAYDPNRASVLARLIVEDRKIAIIKDIVKEAGKLYKDRVMDEGTFRRYLETLNYNTEEQGLELTRISLERKERRYLTPAQVMAAIKKKKFGTIEARNYLIDNLGYTPTDADIYMEL